MFQSNKCELEREELEASWHAELRKHERKLEQTVETKRLASLLASQIELQQLLLQQQRGSGAKCRPNQLTEPEVDLNNQHNQPTILISSSAKQEACEPSQDGHLEPVKSLNQNQNQKQTKPLLSVTSETSNLSVEQEEAREINQLRHNAATKQKSLEVASLGNSKQQHRHSYCAPGEQTNKENNASQVQAKSSQQLNTKQSSELSTQAKIINILFTRNETKSEQAAEQVAPSQSSTSQTRRQLLMPLLRNYQRRLSQQRPAEGANQAQANQERPTVEVAKSSAEPKPEPEVANGSEAISAARAARAAASLATVAASAAQFLVNQYRRRALCELQADQAEAAKLSKSPSSLSLLVGSQVNLYGLTAEYRRKLAFQESESNFAIEQANKIQHFCVNFINNSHLYEINIVDMPPIEPVSFPTSSLLEWSLFKGRSHLLTADAYLLVFDLTRPSTIQYIKSLRDKIFESREMSQIPVYVIANKADLCPTLQPALQARRMRVAARRSQASSIGPSTASVPTEWSGSGQAATGRRNSWVRSQTEPRRERVGQLLSVYGRMRFTSSVGNTLTRLKSSFNGRILEQFGWTGGTGSSHRCRLGPDQATEVTSRARTRTRRHSWCSRGCRRRRRKRRGRPRATFPERNRKLSAVPGVESFMAGASIRRWFQSGSSRVSGQWQETGLSFARKYQEESSPKLTSSSIISGLKSRTRRKQAGRSQADSSSRSGSVRSTSGSKRKQRADSSLRQYSKLLTSVAKRSSTQADSEQHQTSSQEQATVAPTEPTRTSALFGALGSPANRKIFYELLEKLLQTSSTTAAKTQLTLGTICDEPTERAESSEEPEKKAALSGLLQVSGAPEEQKEEKRRKSSSASHLWQKTFVALARTRSSRNSSVSSTSPSNKLKVEHQNSASMLGDGLQIGLSADMLRKLSLISSSSQTGSGADQTNHEPTAEAVERPSSAPMLTVSTPATANRRNQAKQIWYRGVMKKILFQSNTKKRSLKSVVKAMELQRRLNEMDEAARREAEAKQVPVLVEQAVNLEPAEEELERVDREKQEALNAPSIRIQVTSGSSLSLISSANNVSSAELSQMVNSEPAGVKSGQIEGAWSGESRTSEQAECGSSNSLSSLSESVSLDIGVGVGKSTVEQRTRRAHSATGNPTSHLDSITESTTTQIPQATESPLLSQPEMLEHGARKLSADDCLLLNRQRRQSRARTNDDDEESWLFVQDRKQPSAPASRTGLFECEPEQNQSPSQSQSQKKSRNEQLRASLEAAKGSLGLLVPGSKTRSKGARSASITLGVNESRHRNLKWTIWGAMNVQRSWRDWKLFLGRKKSSGSCSPGFQSRPKCQFNELTKSAEFLNSQYAFARLSLDQQREAAINFSQFMQVNQLLSLSAANLFCDSVGGLVSSNEASQDLTEIKRNRPKLEESRKWQDEKAKGTRKITSGQLKQTVGTNQASSGRSKKLAGEPGTEVRAKQATGKFEKLPDKVEVVETSSGVSLAQAGAGKGQLGDVASAAAFALDRQKRRGEQLSLILEPRYDKKQSGATYPLFASNELNPILKDLAQLVRKNWRVGYIECSAASNWNIRPIISELTRTLECNQSQKRAVGGEISRQIQSEFDSEAECEQELSGEEECEDCNEKESWWRSSRFGRLRVTSRNL